MQDRKQTKISLYNQTTEETLLETLDMATSFSKRFLGLMGKQSLPDSTGLYLEPCTSIHCFFMRFPIDVVFVNRAGQVVAIYPGLKPWRIAMPKGAFAAIEAVENQLADRVSLGDQLRIKEI